jgi:hypothetical protein
MQQLNIPLITNPIKNPDYLLRYISLVNYKFFGLEEKQHLFR